MGGDEEMLPRQRIASGPYALTAATAESDGTGGGSSVPTGGIIMWRWKQCSASWTRRGECGSGVFKYEMIGGTRASDGKKPKRKSGDSE